MVTRIPTVLTCSSLTGEGVDKVWQKLNDYQSLNQDESTFENNRKEQKKRWLEQTLAAELMQRIRDNKKVKMHLPELEQQVIDNKITPAQAVDDIMRTFFTDK